MIKNNNSFSQQARRLAGPAAIALAILSLGGLAQAAEESPLKTPKDKASYAIGLNIGNAWKTQDVDVDPDVVAKGIKDFLGGGKVLLTTNEVQEVMQAFQAEMRLKYETKRNAEAEKNRLEGESYLAANKLQPGVITLPSGLQYKILTPGSGPSPKSNDTVVVNYRGTLIDGTEFDNSAKRGGPATIQADRVIKGWQEALQLMKPGAKWQLAIPYPLGYGENGKPPQIGPKSAMLFEIELISSTPAPAAPPPGLAPTQSVTSDIIKVPSAEEIKKGAKAEVIKADQIEKEIQKEKDKIK